MEASMDIEIKNDHTELSEVCDYKGIDDLFR